MGCVVGTPKQLDDAAAKGISGESQKLHTASSGAGAVTGQLVVSPLLPSTPGEDVAGEYRWQRLSTFGDACLKAQQNGYVIVSEEGSISLLRKHRVSLENHRFATAKRVHLTCPYATLELGDVRIDGCNITREVLKNEKGFSSLTCKIEEDGSELYVRCGASYSVSFD